MTNALYLEDSFLCETEAVIEQIHQDKRGDYLTVNQTVFYPQGGGQPSDIGVILLDDTKFDITFVKFEEGKIKHYFDSFTQLSVGDTVTLKIDMDRRLKNAKAHTAGHLISYIVEQDFPGVTAMKGYHFPEGSYVEFSNPDKIAISESLPGLNQKLKEAIDSNPAIAARMATGEEILLTSPHLAPFVPKDKPSRVVQISGHSAYPCGGTHLTRLGELKEVIITKSKNRKNMTRLSYKVA